MNRMSLRKICLLAGVLIGLLVGCTNRPEQLDGVSAIHIQSGWYFSDLAWSPDGQHVAAVLDSKQDHGVQIIDLETESYHPIQEYDGRAAYEAQGPDWSPDGKSLVLFYPAYRDLALGDEAPDAGLSIVIVDAESGEIVQQVWDGIFAAWGEDRREVVVVDTNVGKTNADVPVFRSNLETGEIQQIATVKPGYLIVANAFDVSSTGRLVYAANANRLCIIDSTTGALIGEMDADVRISGPSWSPNGETLAYLQDVRLDGNRGWKNVIYLATADGSCRSDPLDVGNPISIDWSPDGRRLVFSTYDTPGKLYFLDLTQGVGKRLIDSYQECLP